LIWTQATKDIAELYQLGEYKECRENYGLNVECTDRCTSKEQCRNKRIQNKNWKSVEKRQTENGKEYGLFVKENCKEGDLIIEYVGKVVRKHNKNNHNVYFMTLIEKQLCINSANVGGLAKFINHSCDPNCELERWEVRGLPRMCFFANKEIKEGDKLTFDYNWECDRKKKQNVSAGQQNVEGLLKQKSKITIESVMIMTKK
jgi:histone-lysine N-methyltransferase SETD2